MGLSDLNAKDFLEDMVSLCPDSIIGVNRKGIVIIFNQAAEKLMDYKSEDIIGMAHITEIYNSMELARLIKTKLYSSDFGGKGQLKGFESEIVNRHGEKNTDPPLSNTDLQRRQGSGQCRILP